MTLTNGMLVDFRRMRLVTKPVKEVGIVEHYKFLGVHLNKRLDWNTDSVQEGDE